MLLLVYTVNQPGRPPSFQFLATQFHQCVNDRLETLTYDDGPTPEALDYLLLLLDQENINATFFVVREALEKHSRYGSAEAITSVTAFNPARSFCYKRCSIMSKQLVMPFRC